MRRRCPGRCGPWSSEVARETLAPLGSALRLALPVPAALDPWPAKLGYRRPADARPDRLRQAGCGPGGAARRWGARRQPALAKAAGVGVGVLHAMAKAGLLEPVELVEIEVPPAPDPEAPGVALTPDQARAAARLVQAVAEAKFTATLLEGVPGAGKTEVYFEAVAEALRARPARARPPARDRPLGPVAGPLRAAASGPHPRSGTRP